MSNNEPPLSLTHPLLRTQTCILFGFVGIFIVVIVAFGITSRGREVRREAERRGRLIEEGWGSQDGVGEKGRERERERVVRDFRSEREAEERARRMEEGKEVTVEDK
ncbi:hypothetical protein NA56DRAFT_694092 [Hyaloscypha hepaticicola]|uniref:Transmembrane protein n=1 Tax=Hyaloscypha hepaticicola TaxID=2082293 RepID=A0A2J6PK81_9HELO|nr:hypothetical protein NA56DRAFT_694092 [Hyaloscypha hepaticicola]